MKDKHQGCDDKIAALRSVARALECENELLTCEKDNLERFKMKFSHDNGVLKILKSEKVCYKEVEFMVSKVKIYLIFLEIFLVYLKKIRNLFLNSSFNFSILGTSHAQLGFDVMDRVNCKIYYDSS